MGSGRGLLRHAELIEGTKFTSPKGFFVAGGFQLLF